VFSEHISQVTTAIKTCSFTMHGKKIVDEEAYDEFITTLKETKRNKGIVYVIGNGGSAGIASHFCVDLTKAIGIPASTLYDSNVMTCLSNDLGYETVFSKPLSLMLHPQDAVIAISSSGKSENILRAVDVAHEKKAKVISLSGFDEKNPLRTKGMLNFWIDSHQYGIVEMAHMFLLHTIIDLWPLHAQKLLQTMNTSYASHTIKD